MPLPTTSPPLLDAGIHVRAKSAYGGKCRETGGRAFGERAIALLEGGPATTYVVADAQYVVARALKARRADGDRARTLAVRAREGFAKLGDPKRASDATALLEEMR